MTSPGSINPTNSIKLANEALAAVADFSKTYDVDQRTWETALKDPTALDAKLGEALAKLLAATQAVRLYGAPTEADAWANLERTFGNAEGDLAEVKEIQKRAEEYGTAQKALEGKAHDAVIAFTAVKDVLQGALKSAQSGASRATERESQLDQLTTKLDGAITAVLAEHQAKEKDYKEYLDPVKAKQGIAVFQQKRDQAHALHTDAETKKKKAEDKYDAAKARYKDPWNAQYFGLLANASKDMDAAKHDIANQTALIPKLKKDWDDAETKLKEEIEKSTTFSNTVAALAAELAEVRKRRTSNATYKKELQVWIERLDATAQKLVSVITKADKLKNRADSFEIDTKGMVRARATLSDDILQILWWCTNFIDRADVYGRMKRVTEEVDKANNWKLDETKATKLRWETVERRMKTCMESVLSAQGCPQLEAGGDDLDVVSGVDGLDVNLTQGEVEDLVAERVGSS